MIKCTRRRMAVAVIPEAEAASQSGCYKQFKNENKNS